jgi:type IV pilus assembly protein PilE
VKEDSVIRKIMKSKLPAFTLTEVLIVLVIIGILVLLALPNLMPLITKAKTTEAKMQLEHIHTLEKMYFYEHSRYTNDMNTLGFIQEKLMTEENGQANYRIEIEEATANGYVAKAISVVDFDGDGVFNVWEINHEKILKEVVQD